jgi:RNA polymerase sigma factor, sigma-70 family
VTFEEFMAARGQALLRYAVMLTGSRDLALDVSQEALARAALRWRRISQTDRPELYVKRMLTNEYLNWRRGSWFRRIVLRGEPVTDWQDRPTTVPDHAEDAVRHDEVWALLAELPRQQRAALVLRFYESLTDQEIADVLGCKVGTVRGYVSRALATLRNTVTANDPTRARSAS